ncbi:MAG: tRNA (N(6)-L-threonylcarbamoyladenosine(37)-C(2))-methylthiotransferase MtaB, partial [Candidatus Omnitrophota bacterium]
QLSMRKKQEFLKSFLGTEQKVLFEEKKKGCWFGLTDHYLRVKVSSKQNLHNKILGVNISELKDDILLGTVS